MFRKAVCTVVGILCICTAVALAVLHLSGFTLLYVLSGSMEPALPVGSLILVRPTAPEDIRPGDMIACIREDTRITHRVVEVETTENGLVFRTKGDANNASDALPVHATDVIGVPALVIPFAGYAAHWLQTRPGRAAIVGCALLAIALQFLRKK